MECVSVLVSNRRPARHARTNPPEKPRKKDSSDQKQKTKLGVLRSLNGSSGPKQPETGVQSPSYLYVDVRAHALPHQPLVRGTCSLKKQRERRRPEKVVSRQTS